MIRINQCKLSIHQNLDELRNVIMKKLKINDSIPFTYTIFKESIDARKGELNFIYTVDVTIEHEDAYLRNKNLDLVKTPHFEYHMPEVVDLKKKIAVIGFGPAGIFAALLLAQAGLKPEVFERGGSVDERVEHVNEFWEKGILNEQSNVQFGEGGAGTFSDGKLTARTKDLRSGKVLEEFVRYGAPKEILYEAHPHVGTDLLRGIIKNMREEILRLGGIVHFNSSVDDFIFDEKVTLKVKDKTYLFDDVILAIGHSARDTFSVLAKNNVAMESKPFAVGVRIEHPQAFINKAQYKEFASHPRLGAAEYRLAHTCQGGRGVYTFCMCPGGSVVASSSQAGLLVCNGMSLNARSEENANSAILVQVNQNDFGHELFDGLNFQIELERKAFELGGGNYQAPVQCVKDFILGIPSTQLGKVKPTYSCGVTPSNLHSLFPTFISESLTEGLKGFNHKIPGFLMDDAVLTGVETRSSSPIRILRDVNSLQSIHCASLYPCGEGGGFAGGIVSAAIDGLKCAEKCIEKYRKGK